MRINQILESMTAGATGTGSIATAPSKSGKMQKRQGNLFAAEGERTMSRAAKGHEKYGKAGMAALAKAGRDGAGEKKLDAIRDKHDKYDSKVDEVAGAQKCWPGHRKTGTQAGTGKNAGKRVNNCEKIKEDDIEESGLQYHTGVKKHGKEYMVKAAAAGRDGASQKELGALKDKYSKAYKEDGVAENYPKQQDLSGVSTEKLKAYLAKQGQQQSPSEGRQVKRVRAELQSRSQGVAEGSAMSSDDWYKSSDDWADIDRTGKDGKRADRKSLGAKAHAVVNFDREMDRRHTQSGDMAGAKKKGVAEGTLNELSKDTLKSYAKKAVPDMKASQDKSKAEYSKAAAAKDDKDAEKHYDAAKQAKDRTEKRMAGVSGAIKRFNKEGVAEGSLNEGQYEMMMRNGQVKKFIAKDDADAKRIAAGNGAKSVIKLRSGVPAGKIAEQGVAEAEKKGLYYNVNKRKAAGTSRPASSSKAPTDQAWRDAAKTAKKEDVAVEENKKGVRVTTKPRNFVAKNAAATTSGAGAHKDKKKAIKQGDSKHKGKEPAYESRLWAALDRRIIK